MKISYRWKLSLYFCLIFLLFTVSIIVVEQTRARKAKTEILIERLDTYAEMIDIYLHEKPLDSIDSLLEFLPSKIRLTLIDSAGTVFYDNILEEPYITDNHAQRPEVSEAAAHSKGYDIRLSSSNNLKYLYYVRQFDNVYVRVALPYDIEIRHFLKPDSIFLYYTIALFLVTLLFINLVAGRFGKSIQKLRDFSVASDNGDFDTESMKFPQDELGEISEKIVRDYQRLRKSQQVKQEMTGNIAHELRTPVTSIRGYLETILETPLPPDKEREFITKAYNQTLTLSELIHDMSLLTKIEQASSSFAFGEVDLCALIDRVNGDMEMPFAGSGIVLNNLVEPGTCVAGNEVLLYSVFRNLSDNVVSHAGQGVEITVNAQKEGDWIGVSFRDNGRGVADQAHLERLFERFYRTNDGRTRDTGGSGLGLSIVKNSIALHGGSISVSSPKDGGLEFLFTLKCA